LFLVVTYAVKSIEIRIYRVSITMTISNNDGLGFGQYIRENKTAERLLEPEFYI